MDAFTEATSAKLEPPREGTALMRFRGQVHRVAQLMSEPAARRPFVALVAASQHDPELATALRERFVATRRAVAMGIIKEVQQEHPTASPMDPDVLIDLVYGALYYRLLITGQDLDAASVDKLLDAVLGPNPENT